MKRIITWMLALCFVFNLTACSGSDQNSVASTQSAVSQAATEASVGSDTAEPEDAALLRGTIENDCYSNEVFGLTIKRPEGWFFYSEDQIAKLNSVTVDLFEGSDFEEHLKKSGEAVVMVMSDAANNNINFTIQQTDKSFQEFSDEQLFQLTEKEYREMFASAGMEIQNYEIQTMLVGGTERTVLHYTAVTDELSMKQYLIRIRDMEAYTAAVTITLIDDADPAALLEMIQIQNP